MAAQEASNAAAPTHLVLLVNGIWGGRWDWTRFTSRLLAHPAAGPLLVYASGANTAFRTGDGIDVCGRRLAREVEGVVTAHPSLTDISIVAHSMGGLVARYALGVMAAAPEEGTQQRQQQQQQQDGGGGGGGAAGGAGAGHGSTLPPGTLLGGRLRARCLVTIATPHLACSSSHPEESSGGWLGSAFIRALSRVASAGLLAFPQDPYRADAGGGGGECAEQGRAARQQQQDRRGVHALIAGPHAAIANRSVAQLMALDAHPAPSPQGRAAAGAAGASEPAAAPAEAEAGAGGGGGGDGGGGGSDASGKGGGGGGPAPRAPLLDVMTRDWPGLPFVAGLAAFETRALFSTAGGDHLIPWPSSSLRHAIDLPACDPLPWLARGPAVVEDTRQHPCGGGGGGGGGGHGNGACAGGDGAVGGSGSGGAAEGGGGAAANGTAAAAAAGVASDAAPRPRCLGMRGRLAALQGTGLAWRRFDVVWPRWAMAMWHHNGIQMNGPTAALGSAVADAVIALLVGAGGGGGGGGDDGH
ncbi:MAG: putative serine esterase-domain-containing protein [Monoraphidium minutum]|nr:MAG: putative serine esterase-domain-containing protein [Monoraphidium minutum]